VTRDEAIAAVARFWWEKAQESQRAARRDLAAGAYALAINRAYYAVFYAVSALLLEEGHRFKKHAGVRAAFNQHLVKPGRLSRKHGDLYNELFDKRLEADYIELSRFEASYVQEKLDACEAFLSDLRRLLKSPPPDAGKD
jgi:uncharacterized protein (UPF0332 family)